MKTLQTRYFIEIAFDGGAYHGWQAQPNARTVQELLDAALGVVVRQPIATTGCGRTDAGVHARQLYAHFDLAAGNDIPDPQRMLHSLNSLLPPDIAAKRLIAVPSDAHARFDAVKRSYEYHLHFDKNPFLQRRSWQVHGIPDVDAMNEAAGYLLDYHDFACFSKSNTQVATFTCKLTRAEWQWTPDGRLIFYISADRFLRNMVRAIVGTLLEIGRKEKPPEHMHTVVASRNRSAAGTSVPAHGLYLTEVVYPYIPG
ncbi:tRNA pseudouridine(38-40) synthase TruA [Parapedobacter lycopersici]|uniref:tRNA pseudouridine(38-40) synthase TruA n=1 Tax=Parapedobacter lycopersici TaxID=1864939 RepID=UPI003340FF41